MECIYVPREKQLTLRISEEIDESTTEKLRRKIDNEITRFLPRKVIFDFSDVSFMDSAGIGMLLGRYKIIRMLGGQLELINVNRQIEKVFEISGILRIIKMLGIYDNEMKLEFVSKSSNEAFARIAVAAFASQLDPTIEELADIKTAVSEAVTNCIIHGYENSMGIVKVECKLKDNWVEIQISDSGKGIEDIELAKKPLYTTKANLERSGMGFTIMESFMDEMKVESIPEMGTKVTLRKYIEPLEQEEQKEG